MSELTKTQEILQRAVTASIPELTSIIAAVNEEINGGDREGRQWHAHMLRLRGAITAIANARFGFAWATGEQRQEPLA